MGNIWMWTSLILGIGCFFLWKRNRWLRLDMKRVERSKVNLSDDLVRTEYLQLSQQIQPHFLFNALNLLLSLARLDRKKELLQALEHLSLFLRSGYAVRPSQVFIESELQQTSHYLAIQQMRFGHRLTVEKICSEHCGRQMIIPYLLQTFVENAFKHGLEKQVGPVRLFVSFTEAGENILLEVKDNGPLKTPLTSYHGGAGLQNLRRRLDLLYGDQSGIELRREGGETLAVAWWPIIVPKKEARKRETER